MARRRRFGLEDIQRSQGANAAVEFALLAPVLVVLAMGALDFGLAYREKLRLVNAANSGLQHALQHITVNSALTPDLAGVVAAVRADARDTDGGLNVSAAYSCTCPTGTTVACNGSCQGGADPYVHVEVTVQRPFDLLFPYPGISTPVDLVETAAVRLR